MSKNYYLPDFYTVAEGNTAESKSHYDRVKIYAELGIEPFNDLTLTLDKENMNKLSINSKMLDGYVDSIVDDIGKRCKKGDAVFMDYPFTVKFLGYRKIVMKARQVGVKVIFFIHDLGDVKLKNLVINYADEMVLNYAHCLILASKEMNKYIEQDMEIEEIRKVVTYNYYDYLCDDVENNNRNALLCYAGNLSKARFLEKLPDSLVSKGVNVYGGGWSNNYKGNNCGEYSPEELVSVLDGRYGLIWEGKDTDGCSGKYGENLRINASHKFSLYMAARKPVIVWKNSSLSRLVAEKKIGYTIETLDEIPYLLARTNLYEYKELVQNISELRADIISGDHMKSVIRNSIT